MHGVLRDTLDAAFEISRLVKFSPHREAIFHRLKSELALSTPGFHTLCPTRWTVRAASLQSIIDSYYEVLDALWDKVKEAVTDLEVRARIIGVEATMAFEISRLVKFSPHREAIFHRLKSELALSTPGFHTLCPTRWTVRAASLQSIIDSYYEVLDALWDKVKEAVTDSEVRACIIGVEATMAFEISRLVKFSPHREAIFHRLKSELALSTPGFRTLCPTRWTVRAASLQSIIDSYYEVLDALWDKVKEAVTDLEVRARIIGVEATMAFEISRLVKFSPHREAIFHRLKSELALSTPGFRTLCPTRWTVHAASLQSIIDMSAISSAIVPQHSALLTHRRSQSDASVSSSTSSRPAVGVHAGRRIAVATAAPARELDQARRPPRRRAVVLTNPSRHPKHGHPSHRSRAPRSHRSRSKRPHSAKRKHRGKAAKSSSSRSSSSSPLIGPCRRVAPPQSSPPPFEQPRGIPGLPLPYMLGHPGQVSGQENSERMEAWNVFLATRVQTAPQTAPQLVKYQAIITQLFSSYPAGVCIKYDSAFHQAVARDKANLIPWDQVKENILVWCATRQPFRLSKLGPTKRSTTTRSTTTRQANSGSGSTTTQSGGHANQIATGSDAAASTNRP
ncbi:hypothetical protein EMCRGX_G002320 [Ephydatia muelleri]